MNRREAAQALVDNYRLLFLEEPAYDEAIIGVGFLHTKEPMVVYDRDKVVEICQTLLDCDYDDAWEYLLFNTFTAWMGPQTPVFMDAVKVLVEDPGDHYFYPDQTQTS